MAEQLHASVAPDGLLVCGTPLGTQAFVKDHMRQRCQRTVKLIDKLVGAGLPLQSQSKWTCSTASRIGRRISSGTRRGVRSGNNCQLSKKPHCEAFTALSANPI